MGLMGREPDLSAWEASKDGAGGGRPIDGRVDGRVGGRDEPRLQKAAYWASAESNELVQRPTPMLTAGDHESPVALCCPPPQCSLLPQACTSITRASAFPLVSI